VIALRDLTVAYEGHPAVHHLSGVFETGSLTAVVGPNGAGKSTLLRVLAGMARPAAGRLERSAAHERITYLPQLPEIDRFFPISVLDTVLLGYWHAVGWFRGIDAHQREQALHALATVGLAGFAQRPIATLSAGQFQRVLFARLILQNAAALLLDEPFTAIDARTTRDLTALIEAWHRDGRTVIAVLHDLEHVRRHFPQTLLLARECIDWGPTERVLTAANLQRATQMSQAWDPHAEFCAPVAAR